MTYPSPKSNPTLLRHLGLCAIAIGLAACSGIFPSIDGPSSTYVLTPRIRQAPVGIPALPKQVGVEIPSAFAGLDGTRIQVKTEKQAINFVDDREWATRLPLMIQESAIAAIGGTGRFASVFRANAAIQPDFVLQLEVRDFQYELAEQPLLPRRSGMRVSNNVIITIGAQLIQMPARRTIANYVFTRTKAVKGETMEQVIEAFNEGLTEILEDMAPWTHLNAQKASVSAPESGAGPAAPTPETTPPGEAPTSPAASAPIPSTAPPPPLALSSGFGPAPGEAPLPATTGPGAPPPLGAPGLGGVPGSPPPPGPEMNPAAAPAAPPPPL